MSDLEAMAGSIFTRPRDTDRQACKEALQPIILQLIEDGRTISAIVTAMAELSISTLDHSHHH